MTEKKRRILIVIPQLHQGGVERQVSYLVEQLDRSRFDVHLGYFKNKNIFFDALIQDPHASHLIGPGDKTSFRTFLGLLKLIRRLQPDIIHYYQASANILGGFASFFAPGPQAPATIYCFRTTRRPWYEYTIYRLLRRRAAWSICNSQGIKEELIRRSGFPPESIRVIPNFLDTDVFYPYDRDEKLKARRTMGFNAGDLLIASVGRLSYQKNQLGTIRAIKALRASGELPANFRMLLVGFAERPHYSRQVRAEVEELTEAGVCFLHEPVHNPTLLYNAVDAIFQPTHFEGLSNVVIEAQACGALVALSREGDNDGLIQNQDNGLSFSVASDDSTRAGLSNLIRLAQEPEIRKRIGERARLSALDRFSTQAALRSIQEVYDQCAALSGRLIPTH